MTVGWFLTILVAGCGPTIEANESPSPKLGVAAIPAFENPWSQAQQRATLEEIGTVYWHNFLESPDGHPTKLTNGAVYVPFLVDPFDANPTTIATAVANAVDSKVIMTFGEFDGHGWTVQQAVDAWGALVNDASILAHPEIKLVSPYTVQDPSTGGSLMSQWFAGIIAAGYRRPDYMAIDKYGANNSIVSNIATIMARVTATRAAFPNYKLWIPEMGVLGSTPRPDDNTIQGVMLELVRQLDALGYVEAYFWWFQGPAVFDGPGNDYSATNEFLFDNSANATPIGDVWRSLNRAKFDYYQVSPAKLHDAPGVRVSMNSTVFNTFTTPYFGREGFARYVITTDAPFIIVESINDLLQFAGGYNSTGLLVNGVPQGNGAPLESTGSTLFKKYVLPAGTNTLELIDGPCGQTAVGVNPIRYTPNMGYRLPKGYSHAVVSPSAPIKRIVALTDSIGGGAFTDAGPNQASVYQAWPILMRAAALASVSGAFAGARVVYAGTGGRRWQDEGIDGATITASVARLTLQLDGTNSNLLIVAMGINDYSSGTAAATLQTWVGNWADAMHAALASLKVVIVSPLQTNSEATPNAGGSTPPQIRTALQNVVTARSSYMFYVDGLPMVTFPTNFNADRIHLTSAGMSQYHTALRASLNSFGVGY